MHYCTIHVCTHSVSYKISTMAVVVVFIRHKLPAFLTNYRIIDMLFKEFKFIYYYHYVGVTGDLQ